MRKGPVLICFPFLLFSSEVSETTEVSSTALYAAAYPDASDATNPVASNSCTIDLESAFPVQEDPLPLISLPASKSVSKRKSSTAPTRPKRSKRDTGSGEERPGSMRADVYQDGNILYYVVQESVDDDGIISGVLLEFVRDGQRRVSLKEFAKDMVLRAVDMEGASLIQDNILSSVSTVVTPLNHLQMGQCWLIDAKSHYKVERDLSSSKGKCKVGQGIL